MIPKFRVWDKKTKSMWNIERWHVEDEYFDLIEPNKSVADPNANRVWRKQSDVTVMQSTLLHDKNGVDIFEGDIVSRIGVEVSNDRVVVFYDGSYLAQSIKNGYCKFLDDVRFEMEVIGNVHENPELLGE